MPLATSEIVPSPPQAMISFLPSFAPRSESARASPRLTVKAQLNGPKWVRRSLAVPSHKSLVVPPAEVGLTMISGSVMAEDSRTAELQWNDISSDPARGGGRFLT